MKYITWMKPCAPWSDFHRCYLEHEQCRHLQDYLLPPAQPSQAKPWQRTVLHHARLAQLAVTADLRWHSPAGRYTLRPQW